MNPAHAIDDDGPTSAHPPSADALPTGTRLRDYEICGLIGEGGFGIVYLADDHSLQRKVAIKEYMPASMVSRVAGSSAIVIKSERHLDPFKAGLKSFVNEARLLARFDHPSLVKVYRFWEENGTAYMVMPFYEGPTLKTALAELGHVPSEAELRAWLKPVLDAVTVLHSGQTWHQNIGPDNILLTPTGPVLLGLAAAKLAIATALHAPGAANQPGFAAIEQYGSVADTTRGACTDLYALAAVVHLAITGVEPPSATLRLVDDQLRPLSVVAAGLYSVGFLAALDAALAVQPEQRPSDHRQFRALMGDLDAPERVELVPRRDLMQEPFAGATDDGPREVTVPDHPLPAKPATGPTEAAMPASVPPRSADAKATRVPAKPIVAAPAIERAMPAWMEPGAARTAMGKRAVYGLIAATFATIGLGALALQFYTRQNSHAIEAAAAPVRAEPSADTATTLVAPAKTMATPAPATVAATPAVVMAAPAVTAPSSPVLSAAVLKAASMASPIPVAASATTSTGTPTPTPIPLPTATATRAYLAPPANEAERQARCIEILQKASLEQITPAETLFFKKECK